MCIRDRFIFSIGGTTYGMCEETVPFYLLLAATMVAAGFDSVFGAAVVLLGAGCGVLGSTVNPFAVGAAVDSLSGSGIVINPVSYTHLDVYKRQAPQREAEGGERDNGQRHYALPGVFLCACHDAPSSSDQPRMVCFIPVSYTHLRVVVPVLLMFQISRNYGSPVPMANNGRGLTLYWPHGRRCV